LYIIWVSVRKKIGIKLKLIVRDYITYKGGERYTLSAFSISVLYIKTASYGHPPQFKCPSQFAISPEHWFQFSSVVPRVFPFFVLHIA
jgi:hypothetical protein